MKKTFKKYRNLIGLALVVMLAIALVNIGVAWPIGVALVGCWQLVQFARSKAYGACFNTVLTKEQTDEMQSILTRLQSYGHTLTGIPEAVKGLGKDLDSLREQVRILRKTNSLGGGVGQGAVRWVGNTPFVSDDCARSLTACAIMEIQRHNLLSSVVRDAGSRQRILDISSEVLGFASTGYATTKAALDSSSTPLPTVYVPQVVELVWKYGQARQFSTVFPLGAGTVKLPRLAAGEDDFGYLGVGTAGMSQSVTERKVTAELVTFTANKAGGLIRIPTEIEEDTFIPLGQFLARYIARQLAKLEDKTMFLGDGTSAYANATGVGPYCTTNTTYLQQLAGGKTKPTDATINDFRAIRGLVNPAVLVDDPAYYMNPTMEALLVTFNTIGQPLIYRPSTGTTPATLDGFPIRWVGVLQPYATTAQASKYLAMFGSLSYWYLGERGAPRIEVSREVFFATDEVAMRALERIDVEAMAIDAMAALKTAAA